MQLRRILFIAVPGAALVWLALASGIGPRLEPLLQAFTERYGFCPSAWEDVIRVGGLRQEPLDVFGDPYGIEPSDCGLVAYKKFKDQ